MHAWKVEPHSGLQVSKKQIVSSPLTRKGSILWGITVTERLYVTCHIKTSSMSQNRENELVSGVRRASAQVSNAPKIINISQLFRKSSIKQDLET